MFFILSKLLLFLLKPIVWIIFMMIWALSTKNKFKRKNRLLFATIFLFFFSNTFLIGKIANAYEPDYPVNQQYDVGIVLGGYANLNKRNKEIEFSWTGDRLDQALLLYKKSIIKKMLISGGSGKLLREEAKEGDVVVRYLKQIGIPDSAILIENRSRNTLENAQYSLDMVHKSNPNGKILVITSAWHIPRSRIIFGRFSKVDIDYYPTNFLGKVEYDFSDYIIPDPTALAKWDFLLKEWVGLVVDRIRS